MTRRLRARGKNHEPPFALSEQAEALIALGYVEARLAARRVLLVGKAGRGTFDFFLDWLRPSRLVAVALNEASAIRQRSSAFDGVIAFPCWFERADSVLRIEELRRVLVPEGLLALCQPTREELDPDERAAWRRLKAKLHTARFEVVEERFDGAALIVANAARAAPVTQIRVRRPEHRARRISDVQELLSDLRAADPRRAHRHVVVPHRS